MTDEPGKTLRPGPSIRAAKGEQDAGTDDARSVDLADASVSSQTDRRLVMPERSTEEVLQDHLALAQKADIEGDIARNFSPDCVLLTSYGVFRGHSGVRAAAALLDEQIGRTQYVYGTQLWHGELAFLEWAASTERAWIDDGADSYLIRDGRVQVMTIHYTVHRR
jgi:hypothetical protein